jgi:transketolase
LGWNDKPFEIQDDILASWRKIGEKGAGKRAEWEARLKAHSLSEEFERRMSGALPDNGAMQDYLDGLAQNRFHQAADQG